ncbi:hypothetical protein D3C77_675820 [compost metagenome]
MQRYRRLSAARYALDNERRIPSCPDDLILLRLDRRHNVPQPIILILAQPVDKEFIRNCWSLVLPVVRIDDTIQNLLANDNISF